jgi:hypothetical protein
MGDDCGATSPVIPHPPFHLPSSPHTTIVVPERVFAMLWQWLPAALKKKLKKSKKKLVLYLCTLKCTKVYSFVFLNKNIVSDYFGF